MHDEPGPGASPAVPENPHSSALAASEQHYRSHAEGAVSIAWSTPHAGEFAEPQPEWSAFTGQSFEELRGDGWMDAIHPHDRARTLSAWRRAVSLRRSASMFAPLGTDLSRRLV